MSRFWKALFVLLVLAPMVAAPGCGSGQVSEEDAAGGDADLGDQDDGGRDAGSE